MPASLTEIVPDVPALRYEPQERRKLNALTRSAIERAQRNHDVAAMAHDELTAARVTMHSWAAAIKSGLECDKVYMRLKAAEALSKFYETTGETVQLIKTGLGLDAQAPAQGNTYNFNIADPETARVLAMAARSPEVAAAMRAAVERIGREGGGG